MPWHRRATRWSVTVAHRRSGKTVSRVNELIKAALVFSKPRPRFAYIAPYLKQAKAVAWDYFKSYSGPLMMHGATVNESETRIDYPNGGQIRLFGADNPNALRGMYFDGVVFDEFADMSPNVWTEVVRPALADRGGWADFIGTPKGHNELYRLLERAKVDAEWYWSVLRASETGILSVEELTSARRSMSDDQYNREYECSFEASIQGSYYGPLIAKAAEEKRLGRVPHDAKAETHVSFDLGVGANMALWFAQWVGREVRIIDYMEGNDESANEGLAWYARQLRAKPYVYAPLIIPHDARVRELGTGKSREEVLQSLGFKTTIAPQIGVEAGIEAAKRMLSVAWIDAEKCAPGLKALREYREDYDEDRRLTRGPFKDWTNHAADSFRYQAVAYQEPRMPVKPTDHYRSSPQSWMGM